MMAKNNWKRSRCEDDKEIYKSYEKEFNKMVKSAKREYLRQKLDPKLDTKVLWKNLEQQGMKIKDPLESVTKFHPDELNSEFIRLPNSDGMLSQMTNNLNQNSDARTFNDSNNVKFEFDEILDDDVSKAIISISSNAIGADNLPLKFIKLTIPVIIPHLTYLFNQILEANYYPRIWKISKVIGLPKTKDPETPADVRPITHLSALSKTFERIISNQIKQYLYTNNLLNPLQSGFRTMHSTATVLADVTDFIRGSLDKGNFVILCLLDFSKAFNSISFLKFYNKLLTLFNFKLNAAELMLSYLSDRSQFVDVNGMKSGCLPLPAGVPQGSIMGPLIFAMYINDIGNSIKHSNYHLFADDLQIFCEAKVNENNGFLALNETISIINSDINNIINWSENNHLTLNSKKTQFIIFFQKGKLTSDELSQKSIKVGEDLITCETTVKNLGLTLENNLDWTAHVNTIMQKMYNGLRILWRNAKFTPIKVRMLLVRSLILSNLLYCDIVFSDLNSKLHAKIKRIFNSCLRYVFDLKRRDRLTPYYNKIFGCSLETYLEVRILLLLHKIVNNQQPKYLYDKLVFAQSSRTQNLILPVANSKIMESSFARRSARLWNSIPTNVRNVINQDRFKAECVKCLNNR